MKSAHYIMNEVFIIIEIPSWHYYINLVNFLIEMIFIIILFVKTLSFGTFTVWKYMYFDAWIVLSWDTDWIQWICMCTYINCYMYCSTMEILIWQIIDPVMLYTLGYMCQNENIDASAINTGKWKGTKLRAASQKSSKMVNKIPSNTINQQSEEWKFLLFFFFQNLQIYIMV